MPKKDPRGRKPATETARVMSVGPDQRVLRFTLSFDIVEQLLRYRDGPGAQLYGGNWHALRGEFMVPEDITMPIVIFRLEPPTFDPAGPRLRKAKDGMRFQVSERASRLGVANAITTKKLDTLLLPHLKGVILEFPDADMLYSGEKRRLTRAEMAEVIREDRL